jgi:enamine deaminase RidA (YjgF/YER057c/UK114 family)
MEKINPSGWASPIGYNNGFKVWGRTLLFTAGQVAWDADQQLVGEGDFVAQFDQALANVLAVVGSAGGRPESLAKLTIFVMDKQEYLRHRTKIGEVYRHRMGRHFPAVTLVEVKGLLEEGALIEIEGIAVLD